MQVPIETIGEGKPETVPVPPGGGFGTKIIRNALFGGFRYLLVAPIPFVMTPLILHKIHAAGYGTWAVFLAINALTSLADLGLVGTLSKFVAEYYALRDVTALTRLVNSGLALFLLLSVAIGMALWCAAAPVADLLFRGSNVPRPELISLFRYFLIVVTANIFTLLFSSITTGLQRLDLTNMLSAANFVLSSLFGASFLLAGWGLRGLVYGYIASSLLTVLAYIALVRRLLPQVRLNPLRCDKTEVRRMFGFSLRLYITQAAVAVHNQIEKVFLATLVGVAAAGWYDIASDIAIKVRGAIGFVLTPMLPANSELHALGDERRMRELYYRTHKYLALIGVPVVCYVAAISGRFVELWLGDGLKIVALPLAVLVFVNFFNLTTGPGFLMFAGSGNLTPGIKSAAAGIVLNILLSFGLIKKFGFPGAVLGTASSLILASSFFMWLFHHQTRYSFSRLLRNSYLKPSISSLLVFVVLLTIFPVSNLSWKGLVGFGLGSAVLYSGAILLLRFFDDYDWHKIESLLPIVRHARRIGWNA